MDESSALKALGQRIGTLRRQRGLTQERLAALAGMHTTYLGGIERGVRNPAFRNLKRIADSLGVGLAELFEDLDH